MPKRKQRARGRKANLALVRRVAGIRRKRRAIFERAPESLRKDVLHLLPTSRRQIGRRIKAKLAEIRVLRRQEGQEAKAQLSQAIKDLAALTQIASKKKKRAQRGASPRVTTLSVAMAEARDNAVEQDLAEVTAKWKELLAQGSKGDAVVRAKRAMNMRLLAQRKLWLQRRHILLSHQRDFVHPVKLTPGQVNVRRKPLKLPAVWVVPDVAEVAVLIRLFGARVKRLPGEDDIRYAARLKSFTQRALVRLIRERSKGVGGPPGIEAAFNQTLAEDAPALASEAEAGGVAEDSVAEAMDDVIAPAEDYLDQAVEEQVEVPAAIPAPEDFNTLLSTANDLADESLSAPPEEADALETDLVEPDEPLVLEGEGGWDLLDEEGMPTTQTLAMGLVGLGLLWFLSGR